MKKLKIAYINVMDYYSGGEIVLQRLINKLDKNKFEVIVYSKDTEFVKTLKCKECKLVIFTTQYNMQYLRGIRAFFRGVKNFIISGKYMYDIKYKYRVDIVHSNTMLSNIYFGIWAKIFNLKFIAHSHNIVKGDIFKFIYKYIEFCSVKIIVVSDAVKKNWLSYGVNKNKIITIYNGLDNDFF